MTRPTLRVGQTWTTTDGTSFTVDDIYLADTYGKCEFRAFVKVTIDYGDGSPVVDTVMAETLGDWFKSDRFTLRQQEPQP